MSDESRIRIVAGSPTDEEAAAIAALFTQLLIERDLDRAALPAEDARSGWARSARLLRQPWSPGRTWRGA